MCFCRQPWFYRVQGGRRAHPWDSGCRIVVTSDTHALNELGQDEAVRGFLEEVDFPTSRVVSHSLERALAFVEERRHLKVDAGG